MFQDINRMPIIMILLDLTNQWQKLKVGKTKITNNVEYT